MKLNFSSNRPILWQYLNIYSDPARALCVLLLSLSVLPLAAVVMVIHP